MASVSYHKQMPKVAHFDNEAIIMNTNQLQQGRLLIRTGFIPDFITSILTMTP